jgi:hypothetical protein
MGPIRLAILGLLGQAARPARRRTGRGLGDPRNGVLFLLAAVLLLGGGRRWLQGLRARRAVERLGADDVAPEDVEAMADHGRAGLMDLFRLLTKAPRPEVRDAAGRTLAALWARDQLIPEEEKAIVARGFLATWRARRRYPRAMRIPIPIAVSYGVPFLREGDDGVTPGQLEWSHRVAGAERASLESSSPWRAGPGLVEFAIDPRDFPTPGPHRLVLQARVRTRGLTDSWELDLPHIPFTFEFDSHLAIDALLTLPDDTRAAAIARAVRLEPASPPGEEPRFVALDRDFALRDPPSLVVQTPLPCDLAHALEIEFEGLSHRFTAGSIVVSGQGSPGDEPAAGRRFDLNPDASLPPGAIERPGEFRLRALLTADSQLAWADPDVRSAWPGTIITDWVPVRVVRR